MLDNDRYKSNLLFADANFRTYHLNRQEFKYMKFVMSPLSFPETEKSAVLPECKDVFETMTVSIFYRSFFMPKDILLKLRKRRTLYKWVRHQRMAFQDKPR